MLELEPGDEFAGCRIEAVAGRGGMGVVYRATQLSLGRPVALKLLAPDRAGDPGFRERFQRESRMAAAIDHPNVIPVYAAGEDDGSLYLVMRYVGGTDLHALLRERGALEPERAAELVAQVAAALDAAHAAGLVHRDVKPANVLLAGDHAYLSDFGLTRLAGSDTQLTDSGQWIGTVEYCSPEQLRGEHTDARADLYSLGCVLFAALTGAPPFAHGTVTATMLAQLNDPPPRPSTRGAPWEFDHVVLRALAKSPADRYPSAGDLGRAALAAARGEPVTETERSVARGPAAPAVSDGTNGDATAVIPPDEPADAPIPPHDETAVTAYEPASHRDDPVAPRDDAVTAYDPASHRDDPVAPRDDAVTAYDPASHRDDPAGGGRLWAPPAAGGGDTGRARGGATAFDGGRRPPGAEPRVVRSRRRPGMIVSGIAVFVALVAVGLIAGQIFDEPSRSSANTGPLSEDEVRAAAEAFGEAYAREDPAALRRTLARDVVRVLPGGRVEGREQVVDQYERQFDGKVGGYKLDDLEIEGGRAGRASGSYRVDREGGDPYEGAITFGVVRERGEPRIGLIAATPNS